MEFRLRTICIDGLLGGRVQVTMSYETCLCAISIRVLFLAFFLDMAFFLQRYPKMLLSEISLVSTTGENDGGIEIIGVCVKCIRFPSLPLLRL